MSFDLTDAYINIKDIKEKQDQIIALLGFIKKKMKDEGIFDEKEFDKYLDEAYKDSEAENGKK